MNVPSVPWRCLLSYEAMCYLGHKGSGSKQQWGSEGERMVSSQGKAWRTWQARRAQRKDKTCKGEKDPTVIVICCCVMNHSKT